MFSKLLMRPLCSLAYSKSNRLPALYQMGNKFTFSTTPTHKEQRKLDKEKEEELIDQISNLETVAQQDQYTEKELNAMVQERKSLLESVLSEKKVPIEALLLGLTVSLPLLGGSSYLYYQLASGIPTEQFVPLFNGVVKYFGIHQCFQSGAHWGFAISQHDLQTDSINSTKENRKAFILATLPAIAALVNSVGLVYGVPDGITSMGFVSVMAGIQLFILGLDMQAVQNKTAPAWYLKLKYIISLICFSSIGLYFAMFQGYGDKIKEQKLANKDPYRKYIPTDAELLKQKL